jgi:hypothetical protein
LYINLAKWQKVSILYPDMANKATSQVLIFPQRFGRVNSGERSSFMVSTKPTVAVGFVLAIMFMLSCTGDDSSKFVGKWIFEDGSESLELFKDGTGVAQKGNKGMAISWKVVENKRFVVTATALGFSEAYDYEISGKKLTLTDSKGKNETYVKVTAAEAEAMAKMASEAEAVSKAAGTWIKLQQAYIMEVDKMGSCDQIGYEPPGNGKTTYFTYECGILQNGNAYWTAKNHVDLGECKAGNNWTITYSTSIGIEVKQPNDENCTKLTPNFRKGKMY